MRRSFLGPLTALAFMVAGPASALDLPVKGVYGSGTGGCRAFKNGDEGSYVAFNKGGTGEGGEGGCDFTKVEWTGRDRYVLVGTCSPLEGKPEKARVPLVVNGPDEVTYRGEKLRRCPGL